MKKLYAILFLIFTLITNAQIVNIPSGNLKARLLASSNTNQIASSQPVIYNPVDGSYSVSNYTKIDANNDGEIQVSEAEVITYLNLLSSTNPNVPNIIGIESFVNLQYFDCSDIFTSSVTSLDLSQNTALLYFNCFSNNISTLNTSQCLSLETLSIGSNNFTSFDVSHLTALKSFGCTSNNLTNLDISQSLLLTDLACGDNQLTTLNLSQNASLKFLSCNANPLISLDISQNSLLKVLSCFSCALPNLDVSHNPLLDYIQCSNNLITSLDLSNNILLKSFYADNTQLTVLDFSNAPNLEYLSCHNSQLATLNLSQNTLLKELYCYNNSLADLDVQNTALTRLDCSINQLNSLLLKNGNPLTWSILNFGSNPSLHYICADEEDSVFVQQKINSYGISSTCQLNSYCSFTPGATFYTIQGSIYFDSNDNGCDVTDINILNQQFSATNGTISGSFISNASGSYFLPVLAGNHTIAPVFENPDYFTVSPALATINFPLDASPATENFCVTANGVKNDLEITILPIDIARPGFDANYKIIYKNKGNEVSNGSLSFNFNDAIMDLVSVFPINNISATNSLNWDFTNLNPFETREILVTMNVNSPTETPAVNNGDILNYSATIIGATDETPNDNTATLNQTVLNSFDPNDKTCLEGNTITPAMVGQYVHYIIRFENTGTFAAENIVVKDIIDTTRFDINSLVPLHSSHDFVTKISDTNKVEFIFESINLPFDDANNDGYVAFKIKTNPTLVVGDSFSNIASIYFDYNFPIVTDPAITTIQALATPDFDFGNYFKIYPNPVAATLNLETKDGIGVKSIDVYNILGQMVIAIPNAENVTNIDVSDLTTGTYFIKVNTDKGTANTKFVKI
ncbi:MAG: T9SS type A sorting domain-containing protein [Flavobacterium sp. JAD_PAG50586_2]|nr:MAG: T9SS type A sorting domain-containing protein [Flavobacterium sp. JAD_PAG50586_2]